ncbi:MAG: acetyl-CoA carboxylase biotin carboxylase subunit [Candidatus Promineifilaceae bacterium]|nr:acetyl-CoA carboxylase biotin carboxylase subunit [Candidatus Promineifilaceae bacterium]
MFSKILVANRGEIASRIFKACQELKIPSVAVYSEADAGAPWVAEADESYQLKGVSAAETYLNQEAIFAIVDLCTADAIHPGYGFLSENPRFAAACAKHDITFIGPDAESMRIMGSKAASRELAQQAGVPVVPGIDGAGKSSTDLISGAKDIGYPVLIKASAGGGGKGMRVAWNQKEFVDALQLARSEALASFGDEHILVEKFFTEIHHVEIQVLGDSYGNLLHLFERECSIQRRHQKIIEESPAPVFKVNNLREEMAAAAVRLAAAAGYVNAGTVEFIVDDKGRFYFLEMNTRLQVEHPVTEMISNLDLVAWQIRIAAGERLIFSQNELLQRGHAIECRVYAEDPANHFLPSTGTLTLFQPPSGPGVRVDAGVASGSTISPYYDPMLAKIITWGHNRNEAVRKMVRALKETIVLGVTTNITFLLAILDEQQYLAGETPTNYLENHMAQWQPNEEIDNEVWVAAAVFELLQGGGKRLGAKGALSAKDESYSDPWQALTSWRNVQT